MEGVQERGGREQGGQGDKWVGTCGGIRGEGGRHKGMEDARKLG